MKHSVSHFLFSQDLTTSAAGQALGSEKLPSPEEFTVKMGALLRVFTTVVDSLGDNLAPAKNKISKDFSCKVRGCLLCWHGTGFCLTSSCGFRLT